MRVGTQHVYDTYTSQIQAAYGRYVDAQQKVLSGKKFTRASEDPAAASFVLNAKAVLGRVQQLDTNLRSAKDYLGTTEIALQEMGTVMQRARVIAVSAANSPMDQAARQSLASEVAELQRSLVGQANVQGASGQFIFAGQKTSTKPYTWIPPTLTYNGDTNPILVEVKPNETMRVDLAGSNGLVTRAIATLEQLKNDLEGGDLNMLGDRDVADIQSRIDELLMSRGQNGVALQKIEALHQSNINRQDDLQERISDAQEIDMAAALTDMQAAETTYQAAMQVAVRGFQLSLMDFIR